jgi:hypothetical protein
MFPLDAGASELGSHASAWEPEKKRGQPRMHHDMALTVHSRYRNVLNPERSSIMPPLLQR